MKTGQELIKMNIEKQGLVFFEIQNAKGSTVAAQLDAITPAAAMAELDEICESLPTGRYSCLLSKKGDKEGARIIKGAGGKGYFELPLIINQGQNGHIDIHSHNANAQKTTEMGMYERILEEREKRMEDKLKHQQMEFQIELMKQQIEEAKSMQALLMSIAQGFAPAISGIFQQQPPTPPIP